MGRTGAVRHRSGGDRGPLVGPAWAAWLGLLFCVAWIAYGIFVFNPVVMCERKPGIIDWVEDLVFMGLLFVAAALLLYEVLGWELQR